MSYLDNIIYATAAKEAIVAAVAVVLVRLDTGEIIYASDLAEKMFGYGGHELIGQQVEELIPEGLRDRHVAYREQYRQNPQPRIMGSGMVLRGRRKDGVEFPIQTSLTPVAVLEINAAAVVIMDLTEPVKTVEMIRQVSDSGILKKG